MGKRRRAPGHPARTFIGFYWIRLFLRPCCSTLTVALVAVFDDRITAAAMAPGRAPSLTHSQGPGEKRWKPLAPCNERLTPRISG
ncbi:hypothetical protein J2T60_002316 [Natronospira proteinivora]|uniref:Secreted protein n=1 Tax=Natronospira proteinivora TaxID=1807133 RepID=A0ABT1GAG7_9GAMM|nr:hypothetical protein [Natronospira proteinivora]